MPWAPYQEPSLGLSILSSELNKAGIENRTKHFSVFLLKYIKASTYSSLADIQGINEFLFTSVFEKDISVDQIQVLDRTFKLLLKENKGISQIDTSALYFDFILKIRNEVIPKFLQDCLNWILENNYTLIGFTCMFDQTIASLALSKLIKKFIPETLLCFGGYALEGIVGHQVLKSFDFIDIVCQGDGEPVIVDLAKLSVGMTNIEVVPNIIYRDSTETIKSNPNRKVLLKDSPDPNYDDYFRDLKILKDCFQVEVIPSVLSIESSRGCWWGEKSHCVFCGIDEETLIYRQKSSKEAIGMFCRMFDRYPNFTFRLVDYILPHKYFKNVLPSLAKNSRQFKISCEMKSNMTYDKFDLLSKAGFIQVQPGIESFSTNVLKKMGKGVTGIQNILTLKLGRLLGLRIDWNFLYGFPDDELEDYKPLIKVIPMMYHFDPPHSCTNVVVTRFAPLETSPENFGLKPSGAHLTYETIFSKQYRKHHNFNLDNYCYIFKTKWNNSHELELIYRLIDSQVHFWKSSDKNSCFLNHRIIDEGIWFKDNRLMNKTPKNIKLSRIHSEIYQSIDLEIKSKRAIKRLFKNHYDELQIESALSELVNKRIVYEENEKFIGLSIINQNYSDSYAKWEVQI